MEKSRKCLISACRIKSGEKDKLSEQNQQRYGLKMITYLVQKKKKIWGKIS